MTRMNFEKRFRGPSIRGAYQGAPDAQYAHATAKQLPMSIRTAPLPAGLRSSTSAVFLSRSIEPNWKSDPEKVAVARVEFWAKENRRLEEKQRRKRGRAAQPGSATQQLRKLYLYLGRKEQRQRRSGTDEWIESFQLRRVIEDHFRSIGIIL